MVARQMTSEFASRRVKMIGEDRYRKYAVLVPIVGTQDGRSLVFEKRAGSLSRQPGEICFPGGKLEPGEKPEFCAVRETSEELCIGADQIAVLGPGDVFVSPFDTIIYPFIGELRDYSNTYNPEEVEEILTVPVDFFVHNEPDTYKSTIVSQLPGDFPYERIPGGEKYDWANGTHDILFYQYGALMIWGITAYIVQSAAALIKEYRLA
jgi:8-oxo-dGTP pyrophosphatase MutT (NUDIX family)